MSDETKVVIVNKYSDAVFYVCVLVLFVLCLGEPDLLDAIISRVSAP